MKKKDYSLPNYKFGDVQSGKTFAAQLLDISLNVGATISNCASAGTKTGDKSNIKTNNFFIANFF